MHCCLDVMPCLGLYPTRIRLWWLHVNTCARSQRSVESVGVSHTFTSTHTRDDLLFFIASFAHVAHSLYSTILLSLFTEDRVVVVLIEFRLGVCPLGDFMTMSEKKASQFLPSLCVVMHASSMALLSEQHHCLSPHVACPCDGVS